MKIRPTKFELIRLTKRYNVIKKARKMLKDKLDTQMSEIVKIWREAFRLRKELDEIKNSEMWRAGAAVRKLRPENR